MAQRLCLEGVRGRRLHNNSVKHAKAPHLFYNVIAESRPPDPLQTQLLRNCNIFIISCMYRLTRENGQLQSLSCVVFVSAPRCPKVLVCGLVVVFLVCGGLEHKSIWKIYGLLGSQFEFEFLSWTREQLRHEFVIGSRG